MSKTSLRASPAAQVPYGLLPYSQWGDIARLARVYRHNVPIAHVHLPKFLQTATALAVAREFPQADTPIWTRYKHYNENKLGMTNKDMFPPLIRELADELSSTQFLNWLSALTGIPALMADPTLEGGGLHQASRGGFLNLHTDFSGHHYHKNWRRRVNLILYLNPEWQEEWGGAIEFWDRKTRTRCAKYSPLLNHAVIFDTSSTALHGFPDPLQCPPHVRRNSLAFYYYTLDQRAGDSPRSTLYEPRPGDGAMKKALIWLDRTAVDLYSRAKVRFGFSDEFASGVLGFFNRK